MYWDALECPGVFQELRVHECPVSEELLVINSQRLPRLCVACPMTILVHQLTRRPGTGGRKNPDTHRVALWGGESTGEEGRAREERRFEGRSAVVRGCFVSPIVPWAGYYVLSVTGQVGESSFSARVCVCLYRESRFVVPWWSAIC